MTDTRIIIFSILVGMSWGATITFIHVASTGTF